MGRPPKSIISKERAARAALAIIDAEGIDALSLERVARSMGVRAPSLYYHLRNKAELLAEVAKLILFEGRTVSPKPGKDWRRTVIKLAIATRRAILAHPRAAQLMLTFFPRHLMLDAYEEWLQVYDVPAADKMLIMEGVEKLTFGSALFNAQARAQNLAAMPDFEAGIYPNLREAIDENPRSEEEEFEELLERFLSTFPDFTPAAPRQLKSVNGQ